MITQIVGFYYFSRIQQEMLNWKRDPSIPEMMEEHKRELYYFIYSIDNQRKNARIEDHYYDSIVKFAVH
jgi:hypothetical protein